MITGYKRLINRIKFEGEKQFSTTFEKDNYHCILEIGKQMFMGVAMTFFETVIPTLFRG